MNVPNFSSIEEINSAYRDIWKKCRTNSLPIEIRKYFDRWPIQYDTSIKPKKLLFVGLNPSYNNKANPLELSDNSLLDKENEIRKTIEYERAAQRGEKNEKRYSYYSLFPKICDTLELDKEDWNHVDLFPFRKSNQNELISDLELDKNVLEVTSENTKKDLIKDCINIFLGFVEYLEPEVIVVVNGFISRKIMENDGSYYISDYKSSIKVAPTENRYFGLYLSKNSNESHRILKIRNEFPLLLSSMLTGQRALDLSSRERLIWHIGQILVSQHE